MGLSKIKSYGLAGLKGNEVSVEVDVSIGKSDLTIVGLPDSAVKEAKDRVQSAIKNSGFAVPVRKIVVNLAPASMKKEGSAYDLAIAVGILRSSGQLVADTKNIVFLGELSLDGTLRKINGMMPIVISAKESGRTTLVVPYENAKETSFIDGVTVYAVRSLKHLVDFLSGTEKIEPVEKTEWQSYSNAFISEDFSRVKGQAVAKRAIEIAVAGGHNILMVGPPGSGKTMLAKCVPSVLPNLTFEEALEITKIHSVAGILDSEKGIVSSRPFRSPHHTASTIALTGGGRNSKPGEICLAHNGVLFLDELPEYSRNSLETMRQPLEDGEITISRVNQTISYPANFILIASMNPCPCGNYGSKELTCTCTPFQIQKYLSRLSGPLLDRIDIKLDVARVKFLELSEKSDEETSEEVKKRVDAARKRQLERFERDGVKIFCNAKMSTKEVRKYCALDASCEALMKSAYEKFHLSARGYTRILKVARTIADLEGTDKITLSHLSEAIGYRNVEKVIQ